MNPDIDTPVLSALLRARPTTRDELARSATVPAERFVAALRTLEELGFVVIDGDTVHVVEPDGPLTALVGRLVEDDRALGAELVALGQALMAAARESGRDDLDRPVATERVHGTLNQWELWMRLMAEARPQAPLAVFPDFPGLAGVVIDHLPALREARETLGFSLRTIIRADELRDSGTVRQIETFVEAGIEIRTAAHLPGWFYTDAGIMAALPLEWGETVPTSIAIVREPAVIAPVQAYADRLWSRANPLPGTTSGWDPVLELLAQGLPDEAVARSLGQSLRTVRRRVAEASEAFGTDSRFALGAEWARRRRPS